MTDFAPLPPRHTPTLCDTDVLISPEVIAEMLHGSLKVQDAKGLSYQVEHEIAAAESRMVHAGLRAAGAVHEIAQSRELNEFYGNRAVRDRMLRVRAAIAGLLAADQAGKDGVA